MDSRQTEQWIWLTPQLQSLYGTKGNCGNCPATLESSALSWFSSGTKPALHAGSNGWLAWLPCQWTMDHSVFVQGELRLHTINWFTRCKEERKRERRERGKEGRRKKRRRERRCKCKQLGKMFLILSRMFLSFLVISILVIQYRLYVSTKNLNILKLFISVDQVNFPRCGKDGKVTWLWPSCQHSICVKHKYSWGSFLSSGSAAHPPSCLVAPPLELEAQGF